MYSSTTRSYCFWGSQAGHVIQSGRFEITTAGLRIDGTVWTPAEYQTIKFSTPFTHDDIIVLCTIQTKTQGDGSRPRVKNVNRYGFEVIHKTSGSHGSYGFTFSDLDNNAWQIEDYPRGGYYWMFEQGGDLQNKFQPNIGGVDDWHKLVDPVTYEYVGVENR